MKVKQIMNFNVITIPSTTSIAGAKRVMDTHKISHLPVVDKGQLVGIVTDRSIEQVSPGKATSLSVWELSYLLEKTPVKDIMKKEVITVTPEMDAEQAVAIAQKNHVGSAVVVDDKNRVVGILTTGDFFYKIINPVLGIDVPGTRLEFSDVLNPATGSVTLENLLSIVHKNNYRITTIHIEEPVSGLQTKDVCIHINSDDVKKLIDAFKAQGYNPKIRER
jgi:acetoin utilization protein AcuB